ncbi:hypothetical protein [Hoeflea alexandrii]|uniref:hypothetical protein n=1 Tax=Hoeflea alexandrii TaxID=288436 RepID=UPI0022B06965|nr:hypothetical protein [Hoeflea alexandrii]MCZ4292054.1 hypothetical protein [Hoeflea alexandrii]
MRIEKADLENYGVYLKDKSRPPSRGGNKRAWYQHVMVISGEKYSFLAAWSGKFVFKGETVSFDWEWDETHKYRNADAASVLAWTADGKQRRRGERGSKIWRTADTRPPGRRSEWGD